MSENDRLKHPGDLNRLVNAATRITEAAKGKQSLEWKIGQYYIFEAGARVGSGYGPGRLIEETTAKLYHIDYDQLFFDANGARFLLDTYLEEKTVFTITLPRSIEDLLASPKPNVN